MADKKNSFISNDFENLPALSEDALNQSAVSAIHDVLCAIGSLRETIANRMSDTIQAISQAVQSVNLSAIGELADLAKQVVDVVANLRIPTITEEEAERLLESYRTWGRYGWTCMPSMPYAMFDNPPENMDEANRAAMQYCAKKDMLELFEQLRQWKLNHKDLESAIFCYKNRQYKACALLLCGMIESKVIRLRSDEGRPVGAGAVSNLVAIYEKNEEQMLVEALLAYNLFAYLDMLFAKARGFIDEPATLNRNFIGHGMNQRSVRKRDCIQLFLALNNLMQFFALDLVS